MSNTKQRLLTALLKHGSSRLAELWDCDGSEVSRRLNEQRSIPLDAFCAALDELGIRLVVPDEDLVAVPKREIIALNELAKCYLNSRANYDSD